MHIGFSIFKNLTLSFEFHDADIWPKYEQPYFQDLIKWGGPVLMQRHYDCIPNSIPYPKDEITEQFYCNASWNPFTNSVSWMLALAIRQSYEEIYLYGVEMEHETEYVYQARGVVYFIGLAMGMGIKVVVPSTCQLMKAKYLYGYETGRLDEDIEKINKRQGELAVQRANAERQLNEAQSFYHQTQGACRENDLLIRRIMLYDYSGREEIKKDQK